MQVDDDVHGREVMTHIAIYVLHLDGLKELHRQFLRMENGVIIEVCALIGLLHDQYDNCKCEWFVGNHEFIYHTCIYTCTTFLTTS